MARWEDMGYNSYSAWVKAGGSHADSLNNPKSYNQDRLVGFSGGSGAPVWNSLGANPKGPKVGDKPKSTSGSSGGSGSGSSGGGGGGSRSSGIGAASSKAQSIVRKGAEDAAEEIRKALEAAGIAITENIEDAIQSVTKYYDIAREDIEEGRDEAAKNIIQYGELAAQSILESAGAGEDALREFWGEAKSLLQPIVDVGMYAFDEYASMMGIRNSSGELVPYNTDKLRETPGYQFRFQEGQRAVENSAVGSYLSGESAKAINNYGQGMAAGYFDTRVNQLGMGMELGAGAANNLAGMAGQVGSELNASRQSQGVNLAKIYGGMGSDLANVNFNAASQLGASAMQTGQLKSSYEASKGSMLANINMSSGKDLAGIWMEDSRLRAEIVTNAAATQANLDLGYYAADLGLEAAKLTAAANVAAANAAASASSPGFLDYIGKIVDIGGDLKDILDL